MELRYMGFEQSRNSRVFRFDILTKGEVTRQAVVTADMALFLAHRVGIQDGPTLCAGKLAADLDRSFEGDHVLTADDIQAHADARSAADAKRMESRRMAGRKHSATPFDPAGASILRDR
jgi:hypothetical protein